MCSFEEKACLVQLEARCNVYRDSNKATIEFSKMSLRGVLIVNGAPILPIVYSKVDWLYYSAKLFAFGAFFAVLATGATYLLQLLLTESWREDLVKNINADYRGDISVYSLKVSYYTLEKLRLVPIILVACSCGFFLWGLVKAM